MENRYRSLLKERADLVASAKAMFAIAEKEARSLTADEKTKDDEIAASLDALADDIKREERRRENERTATAVADVVVGRDLGEDKPWGYAYAKAPEKYRKAAAFGEFLTAVRNAHTGHGLDTRLMSAAQGAGENIGSDGGFLVGTDEMNEIQLRMTGSEIISRCRAIPLSGGSNNVGINMIDETSRATGSRFGGVNGYWVDEGAAPTASRPKYFKLALRLRKLAALGYASDEALADAALLGATMTDAFGEELKFLTEDSVIEGTGAGQPLGVLNATALISIAKETGQAAATVVKENIDKMWARFVSSSRQNAVWFINQDIEPQLDSLSMSIGVGGVPIYLPPGGIAETPYARLKGRPVIPIEYASTVGTVGDIMLLDLNQYLLATKGGPQSASSMHVAFSTDEMAFRVTYRVDGQPALRKALTPFKGTNTQSPFIALATRS